MPVSVKTANVTAAMLAIGRDVDYHRTQEEFLRPRMHECAVGSADFDHLLRAVVGEAYLRVLRRGGTPQDARAEAVKDGNRAVSQWNRTGKYARACVVGHYELDRWVGAGEAEAESVHLRYLGMTGGAA